MARQLCLTVAPRPRETLPSFFARLAAANGTDSENFATDMGFSLKRVVNQDATSLELIRQLSDLSEVDMATLLSWTGEPLGDVRMQFRGETFVSRALRNPTMRGCMDCLSTYAVEPGQPLANIALHGDWLCRGVDVCVVHRQELVPLWTERYPVRRDDIGARLSERLHELTRGRAQSEDTRVTNYDLWIDTRLSEQSDTTWLRVQTVFSAMTLCLAFGEDIRRHQGLDPNDRAAKSAGFERLSQGPDAIRATLRMILQRDDGALAISRVPLKSLFCALDDVYRNAAEFDAFREIIRDELLTFWPVAPGDVFLGKIVENRRFHTTGSASDETGIHKDLLGEILTAEGAFDPARFQQTHPRTFNAETYRDLLREIPHLVFASDMSAALGATDAEFDALCDEGLLRPYIAGPKARKRWRLSDAMTLREALRARASVSSNPTKTQATLLQTKRALGIQIGPMIEAIRQGRLPATLHPDHAGVHAVLVDRADVEALIDTRHPEARLERPEAGVVSASAFGKKIALSEPKYLVALVEAGHTPGTQIIHSVTKRKQWCLTAEQIEAFLARFTTTALIAKRTGVHRRAITSRVKHLNLLPFTDGSQTFDGIYLRADIEKVLETS